MHHAFVTNGVGRDPIGLRTLSLSKNQFGMRLVSKGTMLPVSAMASSMPPPLSVKASYSFWPPPTSIFCSNSCASALLTVHLIFTPDAFSIGSQVFHGLAIPGHHSFSSRRSAAA